jgi:hypothetical protein
MSALGQKRTFAPQKVMSALPPRATLIAFLVIRPRAPQQTDLQSRISFEMLNIQAKPE